MKKVLRYLKGGFPFICFVLLLGCNHTEKTANGEEIHTFRTTIQTPPVALMSKGFDAYLNEIEEKSEGRIKFERYYSESLVKSGDVLDALDAGIADIGIIIPSQLSSKLPLNSVIYTPSIYENSWAGGKAIHDLYQMEPALNKELSKYNVMYAGELAVPSNYIFTDKPVTSIKELKGLRLVAQGDQGILIQKLGAIPISITSTESFEALQRGTVDGAVFNITAATTYNLEKVAKYLYKLPLGGAGLLIGMNEEKFEELPEDLKYIIHDVAKSNAETFHQIYQMNGDQIALKKIQSSHGVITEAKAEDITKLQNIAEREVFTNWARRSGSQAKNILDTFIELGDKYEAEYPYK